MKETAYAHIRRERFQYASTNPSGLHEIIETAQQWLETEDDSDEHVVLITDVQAAYDNVDHDLMVQDVEDTLGRPWANTIRSVLQGQWYSLTFETGYTPPEQMRRGLTQGSVLSVVLYLLYTRRAPKLRRGVYSKAIVDDITTLTTRTQASEDFAAIKAWATDRHFELAANKTKLVSTKKWTLPGTKLETTQTARLLGACLHAQNTASCARNAKVVELYHRTTDLIASARYKPTLRKAAEHRTYALSRLSLHCLSRCFDPGAAKIQAAGQMLLPKHYGGRGIGGYNHCTRGYGIAHVGDYTALQRTRAAIACKGRMGSTLPAKGFELRPPHQRPSALFNQLCKLLRNALKGESAALLEVATDGGWYPADNMGTIGVAIGGKHAGATLHGKVTSSTQAELAAMLFLATALKHVQPPPTTQIHWVSDSKAAVARQRTGEGDDPVHKILAHPSLPRIKWEKGHATCQSLNLADEATRKARGARKEKADVEFCYAKWGIPFITAYHDGRIQLETTARFVKRLLAEARDAAPLRAIQELIPLDVTEPKRMRKLARTPGAADLLQAVIRRAVLQRNNTRLCCIEGCREKATAEHTLLANDAAHNVDSTPTYDTLHRLLTAVANGETTSLNFFCNRLQRHCHSDPHIRRWISALRTHRRAENVPPRN